MLLQPEVKEQFIHMQEGEKYTIFSFNDFGFPYSMKCKMVDFWIDSWAQYHEALYIQCKPYRKRNIYQFIYRPVNELIIWKGWVDANDDMTKEIEETKHAIIKKSRRCFDPEYMRIGLNSVKKKPLLTMNIEGEI